MRSSEPKLFELDPKSVIKLFVVIKEFAEFDLNKMKQEKDLNIIFNGNKYTIEEKFYIAHYLPKYLDVNNKKMFISRLIKEIEDLGDFEGFDILDTVQKYAEKLNIKCKIKQKSLKRTYNYYLKSNLKITNIKNSAFPEVKHWKRLPLNNEGKQKFLNFIYNELEDFYPKEDVKIIIENSFDILPIPNDISILHYDFENSGAIRKAFYKIYNEYRKRKEIFKDIADNNEVIRMKPENQKVIGKYKKADFIQHLDKKEYGKATDKINIARVMFLTFSKIRENYLIDAQAKNKKDLSSYLKTFCRDIKN